MEKQHRIQNIEENIQEGMSFISNKFWEYVENPKHVLITKIHEFGENLMHGTWTLDMLSDGIIYEDAIVEFHPLMPVDGETRKWRLLCIHEEWEGYLVPLIGTDSYDKSCWKN